MGLNLSDSEIESHQQRRLVVRTVAAPAHIAGLSGRARRMTRPATKMDLRVPFRRRADSPPRWGRTMPGAHRHHPRGAIAGSRRSICGPSHASRLGLMVLPVHFGRASAGSKPAGPGGRGRAAPRAASDSECHGAPAGPGAPTRSPSEVLAGRLPPLSALLSACDATGLCMFRRGFKFDSAE